MKVRIDNPFLIYSLTKMSNPNRIQHSIISKFHQSKILIVNSFYKPVSVIPKKLSTKKNISLLFILFYFNVYSFSQIVTKSKTLNNDIAKNHLDSLVEKYETEGLKFYNIAKYDSAIKRFDMSGIILDSLLKTNGQRSDFIDNTITKCNIGLCYCMMKNFHKGFNNLPDEMIHADVWMELNPKQVSFNEDLGRINNRLTAFIQDTYGDCKLMMGQINRALEYYNVAHSNLKESTFPDSGILKFHYAIKSYTYYSIYTELGDYYTKRGDTANANLYYRKSIRKQ